MKVLLIGFFGMQKKHTHIYKDMWKRLGATTIDCHLYPIVDVVSYTRWKHIRATPQKQKHYDITYCMSGGSLHLHNLHHNTNPFTYDRIVYDSGPYYPKSYQVENYIHQYLSIKFPMAHLIDKMWSLEGFNKNVSANEMERYLSETHNPIIPKLVLTSKEDKIIIQNDVINFVKQQQNCLHHQFEDGKHVQIYRKHPDKYESLVHDFIKS